MAKVFKAINILLSIVLVFIAAGVAFIAIPYFGNQALIVRSGSMTPTIDVGSIVVVRSANKFDSPVPLATPLYNKGDVIAFRSEKNSKTIITHRIVSAETNNNGVAYKTKGDANDEPDGWTVSEKNILGKTFITIPAVGKLLAFAKSKVGFSLLIIFPAVLVILMEMFNIIKHVKNAKKNNQRRENDFNPMPSPHSSFGSTGFKAVVILFAIGLIIPITLALQSDTEVSTNNVFTAASEFPTPIPQIAQTLVMNEILPISSENQGQDNCQFLELWNGSGAAVSLQNFKLTDGVTTIAIVNSNTNLPNGQFAVIAKSNGILNQCDALDSLPNDAITANFGGQIDLNTGLLRLLDSNDVVIDTVIWGADPNPEPVINESIERDPTGLDTALGTNFAQSDFTIRSVPTPGQ